MGSVDPYARFSWRETKPGRWERDIDEAEQFYTTMAKVFESSGRRFFGITGYISLSVNVPEHHSLGETAHLVEDALRKAWVKLRHEQPTIAAWTEYSAEEKKCKKIYETLQDETQSLETWLKCTFHKVANGQTGLEWCNSDPPIPKLPTLFLVTPSGDGINGKVRRDVVLRSPHDIIDGIGTLHLLDRFFTHASQAFARDPSQPKFGCEFTRLSPAFRVAASIPHTLTPEQERRKEDIAKEKAASRENVEIATMPFREGPVMPGKHQRVAHTLSEEKTRQLLAACKKVGVTPTHVYHAAIALVVRDLQKKEPEARPVRYINYCLVNERGKCTEPINTPNYAAGVYHSVSGRTLAVDPVVPSSTVDLASQAMSQKQRTDFLKTVSHMKAFYADVHEDEDNIALAPSAWAAATPPYPLPGPDPSVLPPVPAPNPTPSVSISSMGLIDRIISPRYGAFQLYDPWVTGEELGTGLGVFLGTFRGRLSLSAAYNDAWHDKEEAVKFLVMCEEVVFDGLKLV